jgi:hypothetical protein
VQRLNTQHIGVLFQLPIMQAASLYKFIESKFSDLVPQEIPKALCRTYFLGEVQNHPKDTRIVRIKERADGTIQEIALAVSDRLSGDAILPLTSLDNLASAIANEIKLLDQIQRESRFVW